LGQGDERTGFKDGFQRQTEGTNKFLRDMQTRVSKKKEFNIIKNIKDFIQKKSWNIGL
jgi:hypothetical protein